MYDINQLQRLLNILFLKKAGYKISKISTFSKGEILTLSQEIVDKESKPFIILSNMKVAMYKFDYQLFEQLYTEAIQESTFSEVFQSIFLPFLHFLGLFWQTKTITTVHEHFISNLIYQKIQLHIAQVDNQPLKMPHPIFVLYLPEEEMHEIGLLYLHYELLARGYKSIYLGRSVPVEDLDHLTSIFPNIHWIASFTIKPIPKDFDRYMKKIFNLLKEKDQYWAVGYNLAPSYSKTLPNNVRIFNSLKEALDEI